MISDLLGQFDCYIYGSVRYLCPHDFLFGVSLRRSYFVLKSNIPTVVWIVCRPCEAVESGRRPDEWSGYVVGPARLSRLVEGPESGPNRLKACEAVQSG